LNSEEIRFYRKFNPLCIDLRDKKNQDYVQYKTVMSMYQQVKLGHKEYQHKPTKFIFYCLYIIRCWLTRTEHTQRWKKIVVLSVFRRLEIFKAVSSTFTEP